MTIPGHSCIVCLDGEAEAWWTLSKSHSMGDTHLEHATFAFALLCASSEWVQGTGMGPMSTRTDPQIILLHATYRGICCVCVWGGGLSSKTNEDRQGICLSQNNWGLANACGFSSTSTVPGTTGHGVEGNSFIPPHPTPQLSLHASFSL